MSNQRPALSLAIIIGLGSLTLILLVVLYLTTEALSSFSTRSYAATPSEPGQAIFQEKCQGCHTIGGGRLVGPDLKSITDSRDRDWLVRFITTPDKLIAQDDPIAQQLVQQYGLPMPNLGVTEEEAQAILAYIEAQSTGSKPSPTPIETTTVSPSVTTTIVNGEA